MAVVQFLNLAVNGQETPEVNAIDKGMVPVQESDLVAFVIDIGIELVRAFDPFAPAHV